MTASGAPSEIRDKSITNVASIAAGYNRAIDIDVLRAIACLMVYFYHLKLDLWIFGVPIYGVNAYHLLFAISGYLLGGRYLDALLNDRSLPAPKNYVIRRLLRIYPTYFVCLTFCIALRLKFLTHLRTHALGDYITHYLLIFNYFDQYDFFSFNNVIWALAIQVQFYALLPLAGWAVGKARASGRSKGWIFPLALVLLGVLSRWFECRYINHSDPGAPTLVRFKWVTSYLDLFAMGILARRIELTAVATRWLKHKAVAAGLFLLTCGLCLLWAAGSWNLKAGHWQSSLDLRFLVAGPVLVVMAWSMILLAARSLPRPSRALFGLSALAFLGQLSYSFFLYHPSIQFLVGHLVASRPLRWPLNPSWTVALMALPPSLVVAYVSYQLVERPSIRLASRLTAKPSFARDDTQLK